MTARPPAVFAVCLLVALLASSALSAGTFGAHPASATANSPSRPGTSVVPGGASARRSTSGPGAFGPGAGSDNFTTLSLLNGSSFSGIRGFRPFGSTGGMTVDPVLDRLFVSGGQVPPPGPAGQIASIDTATGRFVGVTNISACNGSFVAPVEGLLLDPDNGLLYLACPGLSADTIVALDPANLSVVASIPVGGAPSTCGGVPAPEVAAIADGPTLHQVYALVVSCEQVGNLSLAPETLVTIDDRSNSVVGTLTVATNSTWSPGQLGLRLSTPLAFDPASGEVYFDEMEPYGWDEFEIVNPISQHLLASIAGSALLEVPRGVASLLFVPALGGVVASGLEAATPTSILFEIDPLKDRLDTLISAAATPSGTWSEFDLLAGGPGGSVLATGQVYVRPPVAPLAEPDFLAVYNLSTRQQVANLSIPGAFVAVTDPTTGGIFVSESNSGTVAEMGLSLGGFVGFTSIRLTLTSGAAALDPTDGIYFVADSGNCDILTGGPCTADSVLPVSLAARSPSPMPSWTVPGGVVTGMAYDAGLRALALVTVCPVTLDLGACANDPYANALSLYSLAGTRLTETAIPLNETRSAPASIAIDARSGEIAVVGYAGGGHGSLEAIFVNGSDDRVDRAVSLGEPEFARGSVVYDPAGNLFAIAANCLSLTAPYTRLCLWGYNASTLAPVWTTAPGIPSAGTTGTESLVFDPGLNRLVAGNGTSLFEFSPANGSVLDSAPAPGRAGAIVLDPANGAIYGGSTGLEVVNASTLAVTASVPLPGSTGVQFVAVDPSLGTLVALEPTGGGLLFASTAAPPLGSAVGAPPYPVTFAESGLAAGTVWNVTVDGLASAGPGPKTFWLGNGTYPYSIRPVAGYQQTAAPSRGDVTVAGSPLSAFTAQFVPARYPIVFAETGPADPSGWNVTLVPLVPAGPPVACTGCLPASSTLRSFHVGNGTFAYLIRSDGPGYAETGSPASGLVAVDGSGAVVPVAFTAAKTGDLEFRAGGLPPGTPWCVDLGRAIENCSTGSTVAFPDLTPGSYAYRLHSSAGYVVNHADGTVTVRGGPVIVHKGFKPVDYPVDLVAVGLRPHTHWKVTIDGKTHGKSRPYLTIDLPNGTYAYSVPPIVGYRSTTALTGTLTVAGVAVTADVGFAVELYNVTFSATGLAGNLSWAIELHSTHGWWNGVALLHRETLSGVGATPVAIGLPNGSYGYHVVAPAGYVGAGTPHPVRVDGGPVEVSLAFSVALHRGLPAPGAEVRRASA